MRNRQGLEPFLARHEMARPSFQPRGIVHDAPLRAAH
jgi:hypothetical protein